MESNFEIFVSIVVIEVVSFIRNIFDCAILGQIRQDDVFSCCFLVVGEGEVEG